MDPYRIIEVKQSVFADNDRDADLLRRELKEQGTFLVNLMSSPGSGKTTTLTKLLKALPQDIRVGIMEADIDSDVDAGTIAATGTKVILVCPAEFDTGAALNMMILSVPEGHDKPLKYPLVFQVCDAMIVNKIDVLPYFDFDMDKVTEYARRRNPNIRIFPISAKTGEGVEALAQWLSEQVRNWKQ